MTAMIDGALRECGAAVQQLVPDHWSFQLGDDSEVKVTGRRVGEWLLFEADAPGDADIRTQCVEWLAWNAQLPGGVKFVCCSDAPFLRVRAELPLVDGIELGPRVRQVCAGFRAAIARACGEYASGPPERTAPLAVDLEYLCAEAQWPFTAREAGTVMVELDVPGAFQQAVLAVDANRGVVASVNVTGGETPASLVCRSALAVLLLRTCNSVRMVRGVADAPEQPARFEVMLADTPSPEEIGHALSALSVAWRLAGREAGVLAYDEVVAREYLESSPWSLVPGP